MALDKVSKEGEGFESFYMHTVKKFDINEFGLESNILEELNAWKEKEDHTDLDYFLAVIKLAVDDAHLQIGNGYDVGLVLAHENPGMESFFSEVFQRSYDILKEKRDLDKDKYIQHLYSSLSKEAYDLQTFMYLYHTARIFNIHGFSLFVNNACSSGLYAIETAAQSIQSGKNSKMIVAAVDDPGIYRNAWLKNAGLYAEDGMIRPFAANRNGFVCGQGGAAIIMEELECAQKRNAHIYAEYMGGGFRLESWKVTLPNIAEKYYEDAIAQALKQSETEPSDIDLINAHGVATKIMDQYEAEAISAVFGDREDMPFVNAFKPYIGHTLGSCALIETAMLLLAMEHNFVPHVLNCDQIDPDLNINVVREGFELDINAVLKISSSFAGYDGAAVFRKYQQ